MASWSGAPADRDNGAIRGKKSSASAFGDTASATRTKLKLVKAKIEAALAATARQGKELLERADRVTANREETEKTLRDHVTGLHSLLDHHHQRQRDMLRQRHKDFLNEALVTKTEGMNYDARLAEMAKQVEEKLAHLTGSPNVTAVDNSDVMALWNEFNTHSAHRPTAEVAGVTYSVDVPQVTAADLEHLVGRVIITEECRQAPASASQPAADLEEGAGAARVANSGQATFLKSDVSTLFADFRWLQQPTSALPQHSGMSGSEAKNRGTDEYAAKNATQTMSGLTKMDRQVTRILATLTAVPHSAARETPMPQEITVAEGDHPRRVIITEECRQAPASASQPAADLEEGAGAARVANSGQATLSKSEVPNLFAGVCRLQQPTSALPQHSGMSGSEAKNRGTDESAAKKADPAQPEASSSTGKQKKLNHILAPLIAKPHSAARETSMPQEITVAEGDHPRLLSGRTGKEPLSIAPRKDGKLWVVYDDKKDRVDLLDEKGHVKASTYLVEEPLDVASVGDHHVLVSVCNPPKLVLLDANWNQLGELTFPSGSDFETTSISVGSTGVAVSFTNALCWISTRKGEHTWIIQQEEKKKKKENSSLTGIFSTAVMTLDGRELVFAAVDGTQEVLVFQELEVTGFCALPPIKCSAIKGLPNGPFTPISISAHPWGFLAVLDSSSDSVIMVDMRKYEVLSIIPALSLCGTYGLPYLIAFSQNDEDHNPQLWIVSDSYSVCRTTLTIL